MTLGPAPGSLDLFNWARSINKCAKRLYGAGDIVEDDSLNTRLARHKMGITVVGPI